MVNTIELDDENQRAHIFATDLPTRFLLVESLRSVVALETDDNITFNGSKRTYFRGSCGTRHGTDRDIKWCRRRGGTVICELAVV